MVKGSKMSQESKRKLSLNNSMHNPIVREKHREAMKKVGKNPDFIAKQRIIQSYLKMGKLNPYWKGGIWNLAKRIKESEEYTIWRKSVYKRDSLECQECKQYGQLHAHHIIPFKKLFADFLKEYSQFSPVEDWEILLRLSLSYKPFWDIDNGITMCVSCHMRKERELKHGSY